MATKKDKTVKECDHEASAAKSAQECEKMIVEQVMLMVDGKQHSVQLALAYGRKLKALMPKPKEAKEK